jgi:hypothetical protein
VRSDTAQLPSSKRSLSAERMASVQADDTYRPQKRWVSLTGTLSSSHTLLPLGRVLSSDSVAAAQSLLAVRPGIRRGIGGAFLWEEGEICKLKASHLFRYDWADPLTVRLIAFHVLRVCGTLASFMQDRGTSRDLTTQETQASAATRFAVASSEAAVGRPSRTKC